MNQEKNHKMFFFSQNREMIFNSLLILVCILLGVFFPANNPAQEITKSILFFVILPLAYAKFILGKNASEFGFNLKNKKEGIIWGIINLSVSLILFYALIRLTDFEKNYEISTYATTNFWMFVVYELIFVNIFLFITEFFWRGFVLNIFSKRFQYVSIAIQSLAYIGLSLLIGTSLWQMAPFAVFSITGGITAYKTKSFIYSYFSELLAIIVLGAYLVHSININ